MKLFSRSEPESAGYVEVATSTAVREEEMTVVKLGSLRVILTRWQGRLIAFDHACPHAAADLSKGDLHRGKVSCHDHDYKFDIVTGRTLWPPDEMVCLKKYEVQEAHGKISLRL
jgi:nitrite reductase/ring-hydroxylating ferredoxin subunit